jgi:hypothetical protein
VLSSRASSRLAALAIMPARYDCSLFLLSVKHNAQFNVRAVRYLFLSLRARMPILTAYLSRSCRFLASRFAGTS